MVYYGSSSTGSTCYFFQFNAIFLRGLFHQFLISSDNFSTEFQKDFRWNSKKFHTKVVDEVILLS